jgi:hypothetical protein
MTAAHPSLPTGTKAKVTNLENGKKVEVRTNDRGPYTEDRVIDLSSAAAKKIDMKEDGTTLAKIETTAVKKKGLASQSSKPKWRAKCAVRSNWFQASAVFFSLRSVPHWAYPTYTVFWTFSREVLPNEKYTRRLNNRGDNIMNKMNLYGSHDIDMAWLASDDTEPVGDVASVYALVHHVLSELAVLKR